MSRMIDFMDDFIYGPLNYVDRLEGLFKAFLYQDSGYRFAIPRLDKGGNHSLDEVSNLLKRYGIPIYCRTYDSKNRYFRVKKRQAAWAEYLLLQASVELRNPLIDPRNARYVSAHSLGWMPTPWSEKKQQSKSGQPMNTDDETPKSDALWQAFDRALDDLMK